MDVAIDRPRRGGIHHVMLSSRCAEESRDGAGDCKSWEIFRGAAFEAVVRRAGAAKKDEQCRRLVHHAGLASPSGLSEEPRGGCNDHPFGWLTGLDDRRDNRRWPSPNTVHACVKPPEKNCEIDLQGLFGCVAEYPKPGGYKMTVVTRSCHSDGPLGLQRSWRITMRRLMNSSPANDAGILPSAYRHPENLPRPVAPKVEDETAPASSSGLPLAVLSERAWIEANGY